MNQNEKTESMKKKDKTINYYYKIKLKVNANRPNTFLTCPPNMCKGLSFKNNLVANLPIAGR